MKVTELGTLGYQAAWDRQLEVVQAVQGGEEDTLLLVEHPPVLTLGASFHEKNLLLSMEQYESRGIEVVRTDRGGDVTYHGPGQLVAYPIFSLEQRGRDLHAWIRSLEGAIIEACGSMRVAGRRFSPHTGVWVGDRKIAAIGIKVKRWVSLHGIALNCNNSLSPFGDIIPCGIEEYGVTSLTEELGREVTVEEATPHLIREFTKL